MKKLHVRLLALGARYTFLRIFVVTFLAGLFVLGTMPAFAKTSEHDLSPFECSNEAIQIAQNLDTGDNKDSYSIEFKSQKLYSARIIVSLGLEGLQRTYDVKLVKLRKENSGNGGNIPMQVACLFKSAILKDQLLKD